MVRGGAKTGLRCDSERAPRGTQEGESRAMDEAVRPRRRRNRRTVLVVGPDRRGDPPRFLRRRPHGPARLRGSAKARVPAAEALRTAARLARRSSPLCWDLGPAGHGRRSPLLPRLKELRKRAGHRAVRPRSGSARRSRQFDAPAPTRLRSPSRFRGVGRACSRPRVPRRACCHGRPGPGPPGGDVVRFREPLAGRSGRPPGPRRRRGRSG